ncbi:GntR family transcriptional regulator [Kribbella sp. NPDC051770]|uniref:GntR family transcriptional regulator n=1 Tax=Kribbella sp. NPDC051770 TaxID=3155413 RepID=UPI00343B13BA
MTEPPYQRIVAGLRAAILAGELRPGQRVPSVRQIAREYGVAAATASRVLAALRADGLVESKVGSGTVVRAAAPRVRRTGVGLNRKRVLRAAIGIADREGLDAVSMRRLASELEVGPMSLYRHVAGRDELTTQMADEVFGEIELPTPGPDGWRAKLELLATEQWALCHRHVWLPRAVSFTRPLLAPNMMAQTEWTLAALDGLNLSMTTRMREALTLHALVVSSALARADEVEAEQETGVTLELWALDQRERAGELLTSGQFPLLARVSDETVADLDGLFAYSLARHLDGFAALLEDPLRSGD